MNNVGTILKYWDEAMRFLPLWAVDVIRDALAGVLAFLLAYMAGRALYEGVRAYRETRARQMIWHPDPKADRRRIAALRAARARQDQSAANECIDSDRRQAFREAQARQSSGRLARVAEAQE